MESESSGRSQPVSMHLERRNFLSGFNPGFFLRRRKTHNGRKLEQVRPLISSRRPSGAWKGDPNDQTRVSVVVESRARPIGDGRVNPRSGGNRLGFAYRHSYSHPGSAAKMSRKETRLARISISDGDLK